MHALALTHSLISLTTLLVGLLAWHFTSSRSVAFIAFFGSAGLLFSGYLIQTGGDVELTYIIPFLVFALFAGRAIGFGYRSRKETELRLPSALLGGISVFALAAAVVAFANV